MHGWSLASVNLKITFQNSLENKQSEKYQRVLWYCRINVFPHHTTQVNFMRANETLCIPLQSLTDQSFYLKFQVFSASPHGYGNGNGRELSDAFDRTDHSIDTFSLTCILIFFQPLFELPTANRWGRRYGVRLAWDGLNLISRGDLEMSKSDK